MFADACRSDGGGDDDGSGGECGDGICVCCTQQTYISKFSLTTFCKDIIFRMIDDTKLYATLTDDNISAGRPDKASVMVSEDANEFPSR